MTDPKQIIYPGYWWAVTRQKNRSKRRPWVSQRAGYKTIVRVFWLGHRLAVQHFGDEYLYHLSDFTGFVFVGPLQDPSEM